MCTTTVHAVTIAVLELDTFVRVSDCLISCTCTLLKMAEQFCESDSSTHMQTLEHLPLRNKKYTGRSTTKSGKGIHSSKDG